MKEFMLFLLMFLIMKNLGVVSWDSSGPSLEFEQTRQNTIELIQPEENEKPYQ